MKPCSAPVLACRHCRHYSPEGRRGGSCQILNVEVRSSWKACALATPPFAAAWQLDGIEGRVMWEMPLSPSFQPAALHAVPDADVVTEISAATARRRLAVPDGATA